MTGEGSTGGGRRFGGRVVSVSPQQLHITTLETACRHDSEQAYPKLKSETRSQSQRQGQSCEAQTLPTPHSPLHTYTNTHSHASECVYFIYSTLHNPRRQLECLRFRSESRSVPPFIYLCFQSFVFLYFLPRIRIKLARFLHTNL